jgi:hypothetical protein
MAGNLIDPPGLDPVRKPPSLRHEERDVTSRPILIFAAGLTLFVLVVLALMGGLFQYFKEREARATAQPFFAGERRRLPPEPRLQEQPVLALNEYLEAQRTRLESYGWKDRQAGIVHIPIRRAIELLAERGLPARSGEKEAAR